MELHGITGAPYSTPNVRKRIPTPYARPSISVGGGRAARRTWRDTPVLDLKPGDVVSDIGRVASVVESINLPGTDTPMTPEEMRALTGIWTVRITNVFGKHWDFPGHQRLYAFTVADEHTNG